jgi:hypothetical protein
MKRSDIEKAYDKLTHLRAMELLIENHSGDQKERSKWMKIKTPGNEYGFLNDDGIRDRFLGFLNVEIRTIKSELGLEA